MDQNNLIVYLEIEDGRVADVSLELLTKGRVLADKLGVKLEALAVGDDLTTVGEQVFPYGVDRLYRVSTSVCRPTPPTPIRPCSSTCSRRSSRRYASWVPHASVVTSVPA